jgi:hypothetical protein
VIEEIRRLMLRSAQETIIRRDMNRGILAIEAGMQQQQQQRNGADG